MQKTLAWGLLLVTMTLVSSLLSYYLYSPFLRAFSLFLMIASITLLFWVMYQELSALIKSPYLRIAILLILLLLYFAQRMVFHRFDFMVGDASDYFAAGICAVTYSQDIGYILPLSASFTAIGYDLFSIEYALLPYVIFYASTIPLFYLLFRHFEVSSFVSLWMTLAILFVPLSIWYAKSSFSETLWQVLLLVFIFNAYHILQKSTLSLLDTLNIFMILSIASLLRVEGIFFYALLLFLIFYHFWKFRHRYSAFILSLGFFILAISIHISLILRPSYLLDRQYNRILPHATQENVIMLIYGLSLGLILIIGLIYLLKKYYSKIPFPFVLVLLSIISKILIAYIYSEKKSMPFIDMLILNEYGFALGNFGLVLSSLIILGIAILYFKAFKGELLPMLFLVLYSIFTLPLAMQGVTFSDPHAFLFYWNRYYFAIIMVIHLFALGLVLELFYTLLAKHISKYQKRLFSFIFLVIITSSMSLKLHEIVISESHLKGSYKLYEWVQKHVGRQAISLVTPSNVIYTQNARPDGQEKLKYLIGRTFSLYKMPIREYQEVDSKILYTHYYYPNQKIKTKFVLCVGEKPCKLKSPRLKKVSAFNLPIEWREHFGLYPNAKETHQNDISKSVIQKRILYASLYKKIKSPPQ